MKNRYIIKKELFYDKELGEYEAYSVLCLKDNEIILKIPDLFVDRVKANVFVSLCNNFNLDPIHIYNVIDDFL